MNLIHLPIFVLAATFSFSTATIGLAQPKAEIKEFPKLDREAAARRGKELVRDLLAQKPGVDSFSSGKLSTRSADGKTVTVPIEFSISVSGSNVISKYSAIASGGQSPVVVTVIQKPEKNEYLLLEKQGDEPRVLSDKEIMSPFAGSEFWIADLALEFLRWPSQMVIDQEMRRGQSCEVLESRPPAELKTGYSRIVSWIASQKPGIVLVQAEAYDGKGRLLKQFSPKKLQRVEGEWQLQQMDMVNRQTRARSSIEFDLQPKPAS